MATRNFLLRANPETFGKVESDAEKHGMHYSILLNRVIAWWVELPDEVRTRVLLDPDKVKVVVAEQQRNISKGR